MRYNSPFSGNKIIDVDYTVSQYKVKEDITIYSSKDANVLQYTYNCGSLTAVLNRDNSISFLDEAGEAVYTVHKPYMYDSAGNGSYDFDITLKQRGSVCTVVMVPDKEWLDTAVYPVVIDPTVTNRKILEYYDDTYIHSGDSSGDHSSETTMNIGKVNGVQNYALVRISTFPTVTTGSTILSVDFVLHLPTGSTSGGPFTLKHVSSSWDEDYVCYNNRPTANTVIASSVPADFGAKTITFDITSHYNLLVSGARTNNGFWIENTDTALDDFNSPYTSNCGDSSLFPVVRIRYTPASESESNNTFATADEIELMPQPGTTTYISGTKASGTSADYDYFKFVAPRHGRVEAFLTVYGDVAYTLSVYNENESLNNSTTTALPVHYPDGTITMTGGLSFTATKDGDLNGSLDTYYIRVYAPASATYSYRLLIEYTTDYADLNWQYPLPVGYYQINSPVGERFDNTDYHQGLDFDAGLNTLVYAVTDATLLRSGFHGSNDPENRWGMGNFVTLYTNQEEGDTDPATGYPFVITYMHFNVRLVELEAGKVVTVSKGTEIGKAGTTGGSTGVHLHLEIFSSQSEPTYSTAQGRNNIINPYEFYYTINFTTTPY